MFALMNYKAWMRRTIGPCACLLLASLPCRSQGPVPIGTVSASTASVKGSVEVASYGTQVMSGSSITAGQSSTATLQLLRGGEVRICPHASLSLTSSKSGRDLSFAMGTGAIEVHYALASNADTVVTPDFRILLAGPGVFHFAIAADNLGNACIRALENDTAAIIVSEQMGDGVYQVRPGEQAYFHNGTVANAGKVAPPDCGCRPPQAVRMAEQPVPESPSEPIPAPEPTPAPVIPAIPPEVQNSPLPDSAQQISLPPQSPEALISEQGTPADKEPDPVITSPDGEVHVLVDAPFVFNGEPAVVPPPPTLTHIGLVNMPKLLLQDVSVLPPPRHGKVKRAEQSKAVPIRAHKRGKGFLGRIRSFFAAIFS